MDYKIESSPILVARENGRMGLPTRDECIEAGLDEFTTARLQDLRARIATAGGDPDAVDLVPDADHHIQGGVDWEEAEPYVTGQAVTYPQPRPRWRIWLDRVRLLRWDVPTMELRTYYATGEYTGQ